MRLVKSALSVAFFTILSRLTGFVRDVLMAKYIGTGLVMDALVIAIKIPSFLRRIFAEGAFNASFVPLFASLNVESPQKAQDFMQHILTLMTTILIGVVIVFEIFMPLVIKVFLVGAKPELYHLAIFFSRITFPFILLISLTALFSGVLNSIDKFALAASSPLVGNLSIIAVLMVFDPLQIAQGTDVAVAIMGSGLTQLLWVAVPCWLCGIRPKFRFHGSSSPGVKSFGKRMIPAAIGSGALQINLMIDVMMASLLPIGTNSFLYYADRLYQLPLSITGTAMGTVLLPVLSRLWQEKKVESALYTQNRAIEFAMLITLPAMVGLMYLADPFVKVLFERGKFDVISTQAVASTVFGFSTGLPAYILIKIFSSSFFARQDTVTPILTALASMVINIILNLLLIFKYKHLGIALATSIAAWANAGLLGYLLYRRKLIAFDKPLGHYLVKTAIASTIMLGSLVVVYSACHSWLEDIEFLHRISAVVLLLAVGSTVYMLFCYALGCLKFREYEEKLVTDSHK
ncbi:murein biosynthesis integral membrane protein MurJ [Candidatus Finniella inopinata]|uniref:Probable lipid II flippase MurJ n=1 Tax=Candidatus Finniella inopinata TaxID=1696036 RepID=A0A4V2DZQ7_9PROT|nr:murein biosynthesis integral membrane protein MurJ [Candidatus Finniella inopinata]RZI45897.1 murein biosynthesis integral membrane protein MurJ [Candidatus Finniella inopinata]